jgi:CubicO group peptidase (beta-lactamase class C family)
VLLAMIVTTVSGQSSAEFLKVRIFDPLGMKHTVAYDQSRPTRHKLAHGYLQETVRSMYDIAIARALPKLTPYLAPSTRIP